MKARKIKTREQILRKLDEIEKDLYFSFGVRALDHDGLTSPETDPRVKVDLSSFETLETRDVISWTHNVRDSMRDLKGSILCNRGLPQPKAPLPQRHPRTAKPPSAKHG